MSKRWIMGLTIVTGLMAPLAGCEPKGPAERAGERIDDAARDVKDAVDPSGPVEKAGRAVDDALDNR